MNSIINSVSSVLCSSAVSVWNAVSPQVATGIFCIGATQLLIRTLGNLPDQQKVEANSFRSNSVLLIKNAKESEKAASTFKSIVSDSLYDRGTPSPSSGTTSEETNEDSSPVLFLESEKTEEGSSSSQSPVVQSKEYKGTLEWLQSLPEFEETPHPLLEKIAACLLTMRVESSPLEKLKQSIMDSVEKHLLFKTVNTDVVFRNALEAALGLEGEFEADLMKDRDFLCKVDALLSAKAGMKPGSFMDRITLDLLSTSVQRGVLNQIDRKLEGMSSDEKETCSFQLNCLNLLPFSLDQLISSSIARLGLNLCAVPVKEDLRENTGFLTKVAQKTQDIPEDSKVAPKVLESLKRGIFSLFE